MGSLLLNQIKKRAQSFIQEKYKTARLALTDVSEAELLAEEVTSNDPVCPDAKTMATIAEASCDVDDYWRIVDLLHNRQFFEDIDIIEELGRFQYIDEKGFNWGASMQKRSDNIIKLLNGGDTLREARLKALRITKGIEGFGSFVASSASLSPSPPSSATSSATSSFGSFSTTGSTCNDPVDLSSLLSPTQGEIEDPKTVITSPRISKEGTEGSCIKDCPVIQETDSLLDSEDDEEDKQGGFISGIRSKLAAISPSKESHAEKTAYKSFSNIGSVIMRKHDRQFSMGY
ncbi:hypothetical protein Tsubulata_034890 [Turnera subulata]|uniref:ENTH domain-containing protein n=1 Tax=Turnera subulata TaxID=218843 RepID=A0A9Q0F3L3_9ROSI|nr:hypothetical protein Tsubulata_034890 [Turnera subulata]